MVNRRNQDTGLDIVFPAGDSGIQRGFKVPYTFLFVCSSIPDLITIPCQDRSNKTNLYKFLRLFVSDIDNSSCSWTYQWEIRGRLDVTKTSIFRKYYYVTLSLRELITLEYGSRRLTVKKLPLLGVVFSLSISIFIFLFVFC